MVVWIEVNEHSMVVCPYEDLQKLSIEYSVDEGRWRNVS
jgi:hypothetical protein